MCFLFVDKDNLNMLMKDVTIKRNCWRRMELLLMADIIMFNFLVWIMLVLDVSFEVEGFPSSGKCLCCFYTALKIISFYQLLVGVWRKLDRSNAKEKYLQIKDHYMREIFIQRKIHLIPKWRLSQMIRVELHENKASRAKRRCLQMLI